MIVAQLKIFIGQTFLYLWIDCRGQFYVGSHKETKKEYISSSEYFNSEYNKRPEDFSREILVIGEDKYIRELESSYCKKIDAAHNPLYYNKHNQDGKFYNYNGSNKGKKFSREHRKNLGIAQKGKHFGFKSKETKQKMRKSHLGLVRSDKIKNKISKTLKGKVKSEETKRNMQISQKKRRMRERKLE